MTGPSTPLDLDAIRRRLARGETVYTAEFLALLDEVERLRAELDRLDRHIEDLNDKNIRVWKHAHRYGLLDERGRPRIPHAYLVDGKRYHPADVTLMYVDGGEVPDASS